MFLFKNALRMTMLARGPGSKDDSKDAGNPIIRAKWTPNLAIFAADFCSLHIQLGLANFELCIGSPFWILMPPPSPLSASRFQCPANNLMDHTYCEGRRNAKGPAPQSRGTEKESGIPGNAPRRGISRSVECI